MKTHSISNIWIFCLFVLQKWRNPCFRQNPFLQRANHINTTAHIVILQMWKFAIYETIQSKQLHKFNIEWGTKSDVGVFNSFKHKAMIIHPSMIPHVSDVPHCSNHWFRKGKQKSERLDITTKLLNVFQMTTTTRPFIFTSFTDLGTRSRTFIQCFLVYSITSVDKIHSWMGFLHIDRFSEHVFFYLLNKCIRHMLLKIFREI